MDGIEAIKSYVDRLVTGDGRCNGMKVLLLDASTTQIISCAVSQTDILAREVYLVSRIDRPQDNPNLRAAPTSSSSAAAAAGGSAQEEGGMSHLKAVCFLRPTEANVDLLIREVNKAHSTPRFAEYHIFFTGVLPTGLLRRLAESDVQESIRQVQEFYGDFLAINEDLITLNCRDTMAMCVTAGTAWARDYAPLYQRTKDGLASVLLSLKRTPHVIRYQQSSPLAFQLARDVHESIMADQMYHFRSTKPGRKTLLLILDRTDDPVTPLLSQWTYQAMVHELLGLNNNRVVLRGAPGVKKELEEVVLSPSQDAFFHKNRHANFGELGEAIKTLLDDFQKQTQQASMEKQNLNSIEEMQAFMEKFPQIRSQSHNVSKHVAIMGELARLVDVCALMDVSQFEQELACADDHGSHVRELMDKLSSPRVQVPDKLRLGLLYALRYEQTGNLNMVKQKMAQGGVPPDSIKLIDVLLRYAGVNARGPGLYGEQKDIMSKMTKSFMTSVSGVSNVYAQHVPLVMDTIQAVVKGKLKEGSHPHIDRGRMITPSSSSGGAGEGGPPSSGNKGVGSGGGSAVDASFRPNEIIVFMAGGVTYEEGTKISEFNATNTAGVKVILAGSTIHNSTSFLEELKKL